MKIAPQRWHCICSLLLRNRAYSENGGEGVHAVNTSEIAGLEQYAVIEEVHSEGHAERFVMAYHDEQLLRELIASPRIVATGLRSRDLATRTAAAWIISSVAPNLPLH